MRYIIVNMIEMPYIYVLYTGVLPFCDKSNWQSCTVADNKFMHVVLCMCLDCIRLTKIGGFGYRWCIVCKSLTNMCWSRKIECIDTYTYFMQVYLHLYIQLLLMYFLAGYLLIYMFLLLFVSPSHSYIITAYHVNLYISLSHNW